MRKVTAILLLSCIVLNSTGLSIFFTIQKAWLRHEMSALLSKANTVNSLVVETITIDLAKQSSGSTLEWEGSDEFHYRGEMYDIIDRHTANRQLVIRCISDKNETALLNQFRKANDKSSKQQTDLLAKLLSIQFISTTSAPVIIGEKQDRVYSKQLPSTLQQQVSKILTPPPQSVSLS